MLTDLVALKADRLVSCSYNFSTEVGEGGPQIPAQLGLHTKPYLKKKKKKQQRRWKKKGKPKTLNTIIRKGFEEIYPLHGKQKTNKQKGSRQPSADNPNRLEPMTWPAGPVVLTFPMRWPLTPFPMLWRPQQAHSDFRSYFVTVILLLF